AVQSVESALSLGATRAARCRSLRERDYPRAGRPRFRPSDGETTNHESRLTFRDFRATAAMPSRPHTARSSALGSGIVDTRVSVALTSLPTGNGHVAVPDAST